MEEIFVKVMKLNCLKNSQFNCWDLKKNKAFSVVLSGYTKRDVIKWHTHNYHWPFGKQLPQQLFLLPVHTHKKLTYMLFVYATIISSEYSRETLKLGIINFHEYTYTRPLYCITSWPEHYLLHEVKRKVCNFILYIYLYTS